MGGWGFVKRLLLSNSCKLWPLEKHNIEKYATQFQYSRRPKFRTEYQVETPEVCSRSEHDQEKFVQIWERFVSKATTQKQATAKRWFARLLIADKTKRTFLSNFCASFMFCYFLFNGIENSSNALKLFWQSKCNHKETTVMNQINPCSSKAWYLKVPSL